MSQDYRIITAIYILFCVEIPHDTKIIIVLKHSAIDLNFSTNIWLFVPDFL